MKLNIDLCFENFRLDVDLNINLNGVTVLFGHSGSGKTALLRSIAGLNKSSLGKIVLENEVWQDEQIYIPAYKRNIGYVFQESSLFSHLSVIENLNFARKRSLAKNEKFDVKHIVQLMKLEPLLNKFSDELSGGERQRVAIARCLLSEPQLLLMDEPLASLDIAHKKEILPFLQKIKTEYQLPIIYVTHSVDELIQLGDQMIIMENGKSVFHGDVIEGIEFYQNHQDNNLIQENIVEGVISEIDDKWSLSKVNIGAEVLWINVSSTKLVGERVRIKINPKDISISLNLHNDMSIMNILKSEVVRIEECDSSSISNVVLRCDDKYINAQITKKSVYELKLEKEMLVWAQIKTASIVK